MFKFLSRSRVVPEQPQSTPAALEVETESILSEAERISQPHSDIPIDEEEYLALTNRVNLLKVDVRSRLTGLKVKRVKQQALLDRVETALFSLTARPWELTGYEETIMIKLQNSRQRVRDELNSTVILIELLNEYFKSLLGFVRLDPEVSVTQNDAMLMTRKVSEIQKALNGITLATLG
jgi:hypothetical protein